MSVLNGDISNLNQAGAVLHMFNLIRSKRERETDRQTEIETQRERERESWVVGVTPRQLCR